MITEKDLTEAIAYCEGKVDPKPKDAILMAACYILMDHLYPSENGVYSDDNAPSYSYSAEPEDHIEKTIDYFSDTKFSQVIDGKNANDVWAVMDELMSVLQAINPRLYNSVVYKIEEG